jgi:hypothetical protein
MKAAEEAVFFISGDHKQILYSISVIKPCFTLFTPHP